MPLTGLPDNDESTLHTFPDDIYNTENGEVE